MEPVGKSFEAVENGFFASSTQLEDCACVGSATLERRAVEVAVGIMHQANQGGSAIRRTLEGVQSSESLRVCRGDSSAEEECCSNEVELHASLRRRSGTANPRLDCKHAIQAVPLSPRTGI